MGKLARRGGSGCCGRVGPGTLLMQELWGPCLGGTHCPGPSLLLALNTAGPLELRAMDLPRELPGESSEPWICRGSSLERSLQLSSSHRIRLSQCKMKMQGLDKGRNMGPFSWVPSLGPYISLVLFTPPAFCPPGLAQRLGAGIT